MAVIGGVDRGLRVGGQCIHKPSGKKAIMLGTLKKGLASVKVQWDDSEGSVRLVGFSFYLFLSFCVNKAGIEDVSNFNIEKNTPRTLPPPAPISLLPLSQERMIIALPTIWIH